MLRELLLDQPKPKISVLLFASQISVCRKEKGGGGSGKITPLSAFFYVGIIFQSCPHRLDMRRGLAAQLDVLIPFRVEFCNPLPEKVYRAKRGDSEATGRHVETMLSTSL